MPLLKELEIFGLSLTINISRLTALKPGDHFSNNGILSADLRRNRPRWRHRLSRGHFLRPRRRSFQSPRHSTNQGTQRQGGA